MTPLRTTDTQTALVNHPAFADFGPLLLSTDASPESGLTLNEVASQMPYHSQVNPGDVVRALNRMIQDVEAGKTIFYDFAPDRKGTGLFFLRGKPGAPFAIVCPGGAFQYVGSLHEGFPYAEALSKKGYNVFVLRYRVGGEDVATDDLEAALSYVLAHAEALGVSRRGYSLWGSSAGARIAANVGTGRAAAVIMAYTGHSRFSPIDPPTFEIVSEDDPIVTVSLVDQRVRDLENVGVRVEYLKFKKAGHGFGLGTGTEAEWWLDRAAAFWERALLQ